MKGFHKYTNTNTNTQIQIQIWIPKHSYACTKHQMIHLHYIFSKYTNFVCLYSRWWQWWQGCWIQFCFTWKIMRSIFFSFHDLLSLAEICLLVHPFEMPLPCVLKLLTFIHVSWSVFALLFIVFAAVPSNVYSNWENTRKDVKHKAFRDAWIVC